MKIKSKQYLFLHFLLRQFLYAFPLQFFFQGVVTIPVLYFPPTRFIFIFLPSFSCFLYKSNCSSLFIPCYPHFLTLRFCPPFLYTDGYIYFFYLPSFTLFLFFLFVFSTRAQKITGLSLFHSHLFGLYFPLFPLYLTSSTLMEAFIIYLHPPPPFFFVGWFQSPTQ